MAKHNLSVDSMRHPSSLNEDMILWRLDQVLNKVKYLGDYGPDTEIVGMLGGTTLMLNVRKIFEFEVSVFWPIREIHVALKTEVRRIIPRDIANSILNTEDDEYMQGKLYEEQFEDQETSGLEPYRYYTRWRPFTPYNIMSYPCIYDLAQDIIRGISNFCSSCIDMKCNNNKTNKAHSSAVPVNWTPFIHPLLKLPCKYKKQEKVEFPTRQTNRSDLLYGTAAVGSDYADSQNVARGEVIAKPWVPSSRKPMKLRSVGYIPLTKHADTVVQHLSSTPPEQGQNKAFAPDLCYHFGPGVPIGMDPWDKYLPPPLAASPHIQEDSSQDTREYPTFGVHVSRWTKHELQKLALVPAQDLLCDQLPFVVYYCIQLASELSRQDYGLKLDVCYTDNVIYIDTETEMFQLVLNKRDQTIELIGTVPDPGTILMESNIKDIACILEFVHTIFTAITGESISFTLNA